MKKALTVERLKEQFSLTTQVPHLLSEFLQWRNEWCGRNPNWDLRDYIGFDFCDYKDALTLWFGVENKAAASQFAVFGHDKSGSMFAYWFYNGESINEAPIVILYSEGSEFSYVMANPLREFLLLLAAGDADLFSLSDFEADYSEVLMEFRHWLEHEQSIATAFSDEAIDDILQQAEAEHPSLRSWIESL